MNLRVITCLAIPLVFYVTGCQRTFIPSSFADPPAINPQVQKLEIESSINKAYRKLASPAANWNFGDFNSGDAYRDENTFNLLNSQTNIERKKVACLEGINHVNDAIRLINDAKVYEEDLAALRLAELRFLRAHFSFELQRIADVMPFMGQSEIKQSWSQIEADFKVAAVSLPASGYHQPGKPGRFAAWAYLSKTYIYQKKWADAIKAADEVINKGGYSLMAEFADVFLSENDNNREIVFAIQYFDDEADAQSNVLKEDYLVASRELVNYYKTDEMGLPMRNQDGITAADLVDPRLASTIAKQRALDNRHFYVIRYPDVLLWRAEAAIELADYETGRQLINQVRRRVRDGKKNQKAGHVASYKIAEYTTLFDCYECAIDALKDERRLELALEGHRFFDLLRWGGN